MSKKDVVIVAFNAPELVGAAVRSVWKHTPGACVTIFDNSPSHPYCGPRNRYIDNTQGQLIDFHALMDSFPDRLLNKTANDWGSVKHCKTIDYCFDLFPHGFLLLDSDVLVRRNLTPLFNGSVAWVGEVYCNPRNIHQLVPRLLPFCCWINTQVCRARGIRYFDRERSWKVRSADPLNWYDTGASFYEDCEAAGLPHTEITLSDWIVHYGGGSYLKRKPLSPEEWLAQHRNLFL